MEVPARPFSELDDGAVPMTAVSPPIRNLADAALSDFASPNGAFKAKLARLGPELGCEKLGVMLTVIEPGKAAFPFHAHHAIEELFYVVGGAGEYRLGSKTHPIKAGDVIAAPASGPERAHQIVNSGDAPLTFLAISTMETLDVVEYPDSGKWRVFDQGHGETPAEARLNHVAAKGEPVDLFDGEE